MNAGELLAKKKLREVTVPLDLGDGDTVELLLRAMPRKTYRELLEAHPSETDGDWNVDTFPPALIAATCVEPKFTVKQAAKLWDEWETGDSTHLFLECFKLNERSGGVGFISPGSAKTGGSGRN